MKKKITLSILVSICMVVAANAQQWANTNYSPGPFDAQEVIGIGNTLHTYGISSSDYSSTDNGDNWTADSCSGLGNPYWLTSMEPCGNKYFTSNPAV